MAYSERVPAIRGSGPSTVRWHKHDSPMRLLQSIRLTGNVGRLFEDGIREFYWQDHLDPAVFYAGGHWHAHKHEILFAIRGGFRVTVAWVDVAQQSHYEQRDISSETPVALVVPAGVWHCVQMQPGKRDYLLGVLSTTVYNDGNPDEYRQYPSDFDPALAI